MAMYKKGDNWFIDYYHQGRRLREKIGPSKTLAKDALAKRKAQMAEGKFFPDKDQPRLSFFKACELYYKNHSLPHKRSARYDVGVIRHFKEFFADRQIAQINSFDVENYLAKRKQLVRPATVNRELNVLKSLFSKMIKWDQLKGPNPVQQVEFLRVDNRRLRFLEKGEITTLLRLCDRKIAPILVMAICTGMRRGEIVDLKWADIDFNNRMIHVLNTKSGKPRQIPINNNLLMILRGLARNGERVFDSQNLRKLFESAVRLAGLNDVTFHTLRHTFASQLAMSGIDLRTIQELMGHQSFEMVLRYAHLSADHKRQAVEALNSQATLDIGHSEALALDVRQEKAVQIPVATVQNVC